MENQKASIGLALSGGGVRGLAHIGVLELLEEREIPVDYLAGTSMGGIVAVLYAAGVSTAELKHLSATTGILDFATPDPNRYGLLGHAKMRQFFVKVLGGAELRFEDLEIPTTVVATDLERGEVVLLNEGELIPALLATSAFPFMFGPVRHHGRWLVDGGVLNNLPVDIVYDMGADRVIGVNTPPSVKLSPQNKNRRRLSLGNLFSPNVNLIDWKIPFLIAESSANFTIRTINRQRMALCPPDVLIEVNLPNIGTFVTDRNMEIIQAGYKNAQAVVDALRAVRDAPLPSAWRRRWQRFRGRLQRAWRAYKEPPLFPRTEKRERHP